MKGYNNNKIPLTHKPHHRVNFIEPRVNAYSLFAHGQLDHENGVDHYLGKWNKHCVAIIPHMK